MTLIEIELSQLEPHPLNSNVMPAELFEKLAQHMAIDGQYPPVIVRRIGKCDTANGSERFQILDGHHRVAALARNGATAARCVVWDVDDAQALTLLATLNRLQGQDDPRKRAKLVGQLQQMPGFDLAQLTKQLPERAQQLEALLALNEPPRIRPGLALDSLPVAVHFFLKREQRDQLEVKLREMGGTREEGLMRLVAR